MASLLLLKGVTKRYLDGRREVMVLDRVSLEIDPGDHVGLWGPQRAGKSTLLRIAAGIALPDAGTVYFDGCEITGMSGMQRAGLLRSGGVALVSSEWRPQIDRFAVDLVATACASDGTRLREARFRARRALTRVDAGEYADLHVWRLGLGERVRVALAMALVREPRLLLVDEPAVLSSLEEGEELYALLRSLGHAQGLAVLIASKNLAAIHGAARRMAFSNGEVRPMDAPGVVVPFPRQAQTGNAGL